MWLSNRIISFRSHQFWRSEPMCCVFPWRRCDSLTTLRPSSDAPSSLTTSFGACELKSCSRALTGASHPVQHLQPALASQHPAQTPLTRVSTEPYPLGSAWHLKWDRPSVSASGWCAEDRGIYVLTVPRHAAASMPQQPLQDTTSTSRSPCTMQHSQPARPRRTRPPSFS